MLRTLVVIVGLIAVAATLQSDDKKESGLKVKGKVAAIDKKKGVVTFHLKVDGKEEKRESKVEDFVFLAGTKGMAKRYVGRAILTAMEEGDPIIIPKDEKDKKGKIVVIKENKKE